MPAEHTQSEPSNEPARTSARSFVWPPNQRDNQSNPAPALGSMPTPTSRWTRLTESIETDLLGRTTLAFDRWAARTGWTPDTPDAYCWRCGGSVGPHEQDGEGCADCRSKRLPWDRALRLGLYRDELREAVLSLKFNAWRPHGDGLGEHLGWIIRRQLDHAQIPATQARLVPIPTHRIRRIARGVDHTLVLARASARRSGCPIARVLRARARPEQVGLSATARTRNIRDAFLGDPRRVRKSIGSCGDGTENGVRVWVLIDDVRTTGATFVSGARTLRKVLKSTNSYTEASQIWVCSVGVSGTGGRREGIDRGLEAR